MEILKVIRGLRRRESGSSERLGFGERLSFRRKSQKTSLGSPLPPRPGTGVRGREGALLIQEGGDTGHRAGKSSTLQRPRQGSLTRNGDCLEGEIHFSDMVKKSGFQCKLIQIGTKLLA